jgi:probable F420-dependent oxidoreductase
MAVASLADLGPIGLWSRATADIPAPAARELARRYDSSGFGAIWFPEGFGPEAMSHASLLLHATSRIAVATGIASIWARDAFAAHMGARALRGAHDDRFVLGLGVSHRNVVDGLRGHTYARPLDAVAAYLDALARFDEDPGPCGPRVIAALGPKMVDLAAARGVGAITYLTTAEHTADARRRLGSGHLTVEVSCVVGDPAAGREVARRHMQRYVRLENYRNSWLRQGFTDDELDGPSDRLVDAVSAFGSIGDIAAVVRARHEAGADHVCLQPLDAASMDAVLAAGASAFT